MSKKLLALLLVFVMVFSIALVGCGETDEVIDQGEDNEKPDGGNDGQKEDKYGGTLRRAIWSAPPGVLHPSLYDDTYDAFILELVYDGMLSLNPDMEYESAMAERWEISDDSKSVTFYLRDGLKWHDGKPVTTEDVAFTFEFIAHKDYKGPRYSNIIAILGVEEYNSGEADSISGIEIIDEKTVKITTKEVYAPFFQDIGTRAIIPKHIWSQVEIGKAKEETELLRNPIGSGPFKMKRFVPDQYAELTAYDDYWDGRPYLDTFIIQVANQDTAQAQIVNGEIDFMDISSMNNDDISFLEDGGIVVQQFPSRGYQHCGVNNRLELFSDTRVRQAFAHAINRQAMVDDLMDGYGSVCNVPLPPGHWAYPDDVNEYEFNPDKAIELLEQVGWEYRDGTMYRDGEPVKLSLKYPTGNKVRENSAPLIQQNLADIGIELELLLMEFGTLLDEVIDKHEFEMYLMGWGLSPDPDARGIWHSNVSNLGGWNSVGFVNDRNDELMEEGVKYLDIEKRKGIYEEWAQLMNEEMPSIFLYSMNLGFALNPKLKGTQMHTFGQYYKVNKWYLEK